MQDVRGAELSGALSDCIGDFPLSSSGVSTRRSSMARDIDWERTSDTRRFVCSVTMDASSTALGGLVLPMMPLRTTTVPPDEGLVEATGRTVFVPGEVGGRAMGT